jgi:hypothetical protein
VVGGIKEIRHKCSPTSSESSMSLGGWEHMRQLLLQRSVAKSELCGEAIR